MTNMQSLNRNPSFDNPQDHAAYHCGRLLAQLENYSSVRRRKRLMPTFS